MVGPRMPYVCCMWPQFAALSSQSGHTQDKINDLATVLWRISYRFNCSAINCAVLRLTTMSFHSLSLTHSLALALSFVFNTKIYIINCVMIVILQESVPPGLVQFTTITDVRLYLHEQSYETTMRSHIQYGKS